MRPGDGAMKWIKSFGGAASMRPGRMRPGDPLPAVEKPLMSMRFNEAGAHAPRRYCNHYVIPRSVKECFNEAGAHAPRRCWPPWCPVAAWRPLQ